MAAFKLGDAFNNLLSGPSLMDTVKAGGRRGAPSPDGKENDERALKGPRFSPSKAPPKGSGRGSDGVLGQSPLGENGAKKPDDLLGQISALLDDKLEPLTIHVNAMGHDLAAFKEEAGKEFKKIAGFANRIHVSLRLKSNTRNSRLKAIRTKITRQGWWHSIPSKKPSGQSS